MARRQLELSNEVAAELAGAQDQILRTLEEHLDCAIYLRGNVVTLDGDADAVQAGATVVRELSSLVARGHEIGPATIESVARVLDERESPAQVLEDVVWRHRNLKVAPKSVNQKRYVDAIRRSTITFGVGPAGTGKTFLAIAMAVAALSKREVNRIILTRPAVEAGERLGFLPGDLMAKVDPYLRPLFDALHDMLDAERVAAHLEKAVIEVAPLAFMRGRTLNDSFVILDEAQNTSPEQMKMFLTRLGFGSRMVVTGDITQVDLPREQKSGLIVVNDILTGVEGIEFIRFGGEDVVRHKLVQRIVAAYDEHSQRQAPELRPRAAAQAPIQVVLDVEVIGSSALPEETLRRLVAIALASARRSRTATSRSSSSTPSGSPRSTSSTAASRARPTCSRSRSTSTGPRSARASSATSSSAPSTPSDLAEAVVHGTLHLVGMDHETDHGEMLALQAEIVSWVK